MAMELNTLRTLGIRASYLAGCALHGIAAEDSGENLEELLKFCRFHSITAIVAMALESVPALGEKLKPWKQEKDLAIRKNILLNAEREQVLKHLETIGCRYMPLKGSLLQFDYPRFGMRQMSDNDILFDEARTEEIHRFMLDRGYEAVTYRIGNHDEYVKKPVYNMELHRSLFQGGVDPVLAGYYRDVFSRLRKDEGNRYGYHMSREDFYVYLVAHGYKHWRSGGVGIRNLLDVYVYESKYRDNLNWEYIRCELEKIQAAGFEEECRTLARILFEKPCPSPRLSERERNAMDAFFSSGAFGTEERAVENKLENLRENGKSSGKMRYVLERLFPPVSYLAENYPGIKKQKWKLPFIYLLRLLKAVFLYPVRILRELRLLVRSK